MSHHISPFYSIQTGRTFRAVTPSARLGVDWHQISARTKPNCYQSFAKPRCGCRPAERSPCLSLAFSLFSLGSLKENVLPQPIASGDITFMCPALSRFPDSVPTFLTALPMAARFQIFRAFLHSKCFKRKKHMSEARPHSQKPSERTIMRVWWAKSHGFQHCHHRIGLTLTPPLIPFA